jgi:predicted CoA-substrate-specific enzyme activase
MYTIGYDIGTRFIKICIVKNGRIISYTITEYGPDIKSSIHKAYKEVMSKAKINSWNIKNTAATGYGDAFVKKARVKVNNEVCIARAAYKLNPEVKTIIDVGALFIHTVKIGKNGLILDSMENEKCAAGSGKFLETITKAVELPFEDLSNEVSKSQNPYNVTISCSVFAESEIISQVNQGRSREDILSGLVHSIASKVKTMVERMGKETPIFITGGLSKIEIFKKVLEEHLGCGVGRLDCDSQILSAFGAGLIAEEKVRKCK